MKIPRAPRSNAHSHLRPKVDYHNHCLSSAIFPSGYRTTRPRFGNVFPAVMRPGASALHRFAINQSFSSVFSHSLAFRRTLLHMLDRKSVGAPRGAAQGRAKARSTITDFVFPEAGGFRLLANRSAVRPMQPLDKCASEGLAPPLITQG